MRITHPDWLTLPARDYAPSARMAHVLGEHGVHTVCVSADCPNAGECFARGTCTFMILGEICTRDCRFCAVRHGTAGATRSRRAGAGRARCPAFWGSGTWW